MTNWRSELLAREPKGTEADLLLVAECGAKYDAQDAEFWRGQAWWYRFQARMAGGAALLLFVALVYMIWRAA